MDYTIREHYAERAGHHFDLHLQTGLDAFESWAIPKGMPKPGERHLAIRTSEHTTEGAHTSGRIPEGYGKGITGIVDEGEYVLISGRDGNRFIRLLGPNYGGSYHLKHWTGNRWLIWREQ